MVEKNSSTQQAQQLDRLVEQTKRRVDQLVADGMRYAQNGQISSMERAVVNIQVFIKNPKLPRDLIHAAQRAIVTMEKEGYIFYIDDLLAQAREAAQEQRLRQKQALLEMIRDYLPKAMKAGASEEFRNSVQRRVELVNFTGNPVTPSETGTRAKPLDKLKQVFSNRAKSPESGSDGTS